MRKPTILAALLCFVLGGTLCSIPAHAGYRYRYQVTVDHTQAGSSDSANFPILVYISSNAGFKTAANGGYIQNTTTLNGQTVPADLIVTTDTACSTKVTAWEVASYSASSGTVELWVNQGTLSHTVDTVFYICIGNSAVTTYQSTATSTWNSNYIGVWHIPNGTTLASPSNDSTANAYNLTVSGATVATGAIDGGATTGSAKYFHRSDTGFPTGASNLSMSCWVKSTDTSGADIFFNYGSSSGGNEQPYLGMYSLGAGHTNNAGIVGFGGSNNISTPAAINDGNWHFLVATENTSGNVILYLDGASAATETVTINKVLGGAFTLGAATNATQPFPGTMDEGRLTGSVLSPDWITAEYNMAKPSQTMVTVGSKVALSGPRGSQIMDLETGLLTKGLH